MRQSFANVARIWVRLSKLHPDIVSGWLTARRSRVCARPNWQLTAPPNGRPTNIVSSLKEGANTSAQSDSTTDEHGPSLGELQEEPRPATEPKIRKCLICRRPFPSAWAGERVCRRCKATAAWRSGGLQRDDKTAAKPLSASRRKAIHGMRNQSTPQNGAPCTIAQRDICNLTDTDGLPEHFPSEKG